MLTSVHHEDKIQTQIFSEIFKRHQAFNKKLEFKYFTLCIFLGFQRRERF